MSYNILVISEFSGSEPKRISLELLAIAEKVNKEMNGEITTLVYGDSADPSKLKQYSNILHY